MRFLYATGGDRGGYGVLTAPNHKGIPLGIIQGKPWAADVGCLDGPDFVKRASIDDIFGRKEVADFKLGDTKILPSWIEVMRPYKSQCLFIAGFDIVGDSVGTLETFEEFSTYFTSGGWPFAYVSQNGSENLPIPENAAAVFVGGVPTGRTVRQSNGYQDMDWKDSMESVSVIKRAQAMGKHIHIGRVNWGRRYKLFRVLKGSEKFTCDGTRTRYGATKAYRDWKAYERQLPLLQI